MTPTEFTNRYYMFVQMIYETISSLPDPSDFNEDHPLGATEIQRIKDGLRSVEHRIRNLSEQLDNELATKPARMN